MFADDGAVLGFGQAAVVGVARPGFGEFHRQIVEHPRHLAIDVLGAVVGMEAENAQRESGEQGFDLSCSVFDLTGIAQWD